MNELKSKLKSKPKSKLNSQRQFQEGLKKHLKGIPLFRGGGVGAMPCRGLFSFNLTNTKYI